MRNLSVAIFFLLFSFKVSAENIDAEDIVDLTSLHYDLVYAGEIEVETELLKLLMEIDQLVKNGNIEKSRELLFKRMVRSVYLINETANKLSVENGKNEALNALYHFKYYLPQEGFLELYPESNDWSLKKMHNTLKSINYPEVEPPKYGKSDDWRRAWFIKTDSLLKKTESASLTRQ